MILSPMIRVALLAAFLVGANCRLAEPSPATARELLVEKPLTPQPDTTLVPAPQVVTSEADALATPAKNSSVIDQATLEALAREITPPNYHGPPIIFYPDGGCSICAPPPPAVVLNPEQRFFAAPIFSP